MRTWFALLLALFFAVPLSAQKLTPRIVPGARVRVTTIDPSWEQPLARFLALQVDTLILVRPSGDTTRLSLGDVSHMEVLVSYRAHTGMLGGIVGAVAMYKLTKTDPNTELIPGVRRVENAVAGTIAGALIGYWLGPNDRWRAVRYR